MTAGSLDATFKQTQKMASSQDAVAAAIQQSTQVAIDQQDWWQTFADQQAAATTAAEAANDSLIAEIQGLREQVKELAADQRTGDAAIAANTGRIAKTLDNATATTGGDSLAVTVQNTVSTRDVA